MPMAPLDRADARGWIEARIALESVDHGARRLLAFADEVEVLGPPALRAQTRERIRAIVALYSSGAGPARFMA
jgi:predicted DNA-binding transcriptional regulator YafY